MHDPAYIAIDDDGYLALYWGDGTETEKYVIARGARATEGPTLIQAIEDLKLWAEDNGYDIIVPMYDMEASDVEIDLPESDAAILDYDEIDTMLDNLDSLDSYQDYHDYEIPPDADYDPPSG